ncbi:hypothetical protein AC1031_015067 [Aphanomyces cochlioides]|nr:hypothetical protein AC1031_015067 [Aphanomyces cochlioides]
MSDSSASESSPYSSSSDSDARRGGSLHLRPSDGSEATPIVINGSSPETPARSRKRKGSSAKRSKSGRPKKRRHVDPFAVTPPMPRSKTEKARIPSSAPSSPGGRSDSTAVPDVASDEKPYDSAPGLDHLPAVYHPIHVLEQNNIDATLNHLVGSVNVSRQINSPVPADLGRLADAMVDMAHVLVEQRRRLANTTGRLEAQQFNQEVPRIRQARERISNKIAAEPIPAPTPQDNLFGGRMSDGSSCEVPRDACFLRREGIHVDDSTQTLCYGRSIKLGKHARCRNYWRRCKVHNPVYHRNYYKATNKIPDDSSARGLVHNSSELLREVERTFGNKGHTVQTKSGAKGKSRGRASEVKEDELYLRGPQYPTRLTYDHRHERLARLTLFLQAVDQGPDVDDQGTDNPPDDHPGDDARPPDSPPADGAAGMIDV